MTFYFHPKALKKKIPCVCDCYHILFTNIERIKREREPLHTYTCICNAVNKYINSIAYNVIAIATAPMAAAVNWFDFLKRIHRAKIIIFTHSICTFAKQKVK